MSAIFLSVRLAGNTVNASMGSVQYYTGYTYQKVCADGFDDIAASVVCQELGYMSGVAVYAGAFPDHQGLSYGVSQVKCLGGENRLIECDLIMGSYCGPGPASVLCSKQEISNFGMKFPTLMFFSRFSLFLLFIAFDLLSILIFQSNLFLLPLLIADNFDFL